jgi:LCP family protein required for cell wall assembly
MMSTSIADTAVAVDETSEISPGVAAKMVHVLVLPGLALIRNARAVGLMLFIAGVLVPAFVFGEALSFYDDWPQLGDHRQLLAWIPVSIVLFALTRLAAVWLSAGQFPLRQRKRFLVGGSIVTAALCVPAVTAAVYVDRVGDAVDQVFAPARAEAIITAPNDVLAAEFHTVLLLGGDSGRGRVGLRTDTMMLAMIHRPTGRAAMISIPRNMDEMVLLPGSPLAEEYPDGFSDLLNALYPTVESNPDLVEAYAEPELDPAALALMETISYSMGVTIDDYALVNMAGFVQLVDAVGGVTIDLPAKVSMPGDPYGAYYRLPPTIGPGPTFMDGTKALGYVRSRVDDSDYQRMERQRFLLQQVASKVGITDVFTSFSDLEGAIKNNVRTSMSIDETHTLLLALQASDRDITSVGLVPPLVDPDEPNWFEVQQIVLDTRAQLTTD